MAGEMAVVLRCRDRWNREIVPAEHTWHDHILADHAELVGNLEAVERTLRRPSRVALDKDDPSREVYYRRGVLPAAYGRDYLKVVVEFSASEIAFPGEGRIVTAYATERMKSGETQRWP